MKIKVKIGDVFSISIAENQLVYGQVLHIYLQNQYLIAIYEKKYSEIEKPRMEEIVHDRILFIGYTLDAKFYHENWKVVGNINENLDSISKPYFKVGSEPEVLVTNYKGEVLHKASKMEADILPYMFVVAPVRYEKALKAFYKLLPWEKNFDELLYSTVEKKNGVAFHI